MTHDWRVKTHNWRFAVLVTVPVIVVAILLGFMICSQYLVFKGDSPEQANFFCMAVVR
jgi:hypothetical protein